jgi:hypothetical protein
VDGIKKTNFDLKNLTRKFFNSKTKLEYFQGFLQRIRRFIRLLLPWRFHWKEEMFSNKED